MLVQWRPEIKELWSVSGAIALLFIIPLALPWVVLAWMTPILPRRVRSSVDNLLFDVILVRPWRGAFASFLVLLLLGFVICS